MGICSSYRTLPSFRQISRPSIRVTFVTSRKDRNMSRCTPLALLSLHRTDIVVLSFTYRFSRTEARKATRAQGGFYCC